MARINAELLSRIVDKVGSQNTAYRHIRDKANSTQLARHLAAILVASDLGISTLKKAYASDEERAQLRPYMGGEVRKPVATEPPSTHTAEAARNGPRRRSRQRKPNARVFVVHGRDEPVRAALFQFLRAIGLDPLEWSRAVQRVRAGAPFIGDVLDRAIVDAGAVVVLLTPDDMAQLRPALRRRTDPAYERRLTGQPRANVLLEAGMALGHHPNKTILVEVGSIRPCSDLSGRHAVRLSNAPERRRELAARLKAIGCPVNDEGSDWLSVGNFSITPERRVSATRKKVSR